MHIPHYDNKNVAIVGIGDPDLPLAYFNIVRLRRGEKFTSAVPGYETCLVPAHGMIDVEIETDGGISGSSFADAHLFGTAIPPQYMFPRDLAHASSVVLKPRKSSLPARASIRPLKLSLCALATSTRFSMAQMRPRLIVK